MVEIKSNTIVLTKGDTAVISVAIKNSDGSDYEPQEGDVIRFAMKKNYTDPEPLLVKTISPQTLEFRIESNETKGFEAGPVNGKYKYDIELTRADGTVDTFIPRADFILLEEVL